MEKKTEIEISYNNWFGFYMCITLLILMMVGEPDLLTAIINYIIGAAKCQS